MAIILSNHWLEKRRPYWERLSTLLNQAGAISVRQLSRAELRETALLYRQAASDLSTLRQDPTARSYAEHVNQLLARAHHIIYSNRGTTFLKLLRFLRDGYPVVFRRHIRYVLVSLIILLAGAALGSVLTLARPEFMHRMLGPEMVATIERHEMWTHSIVGVEPMASSMIMTNNLSVCFIAFAGGILFGLLTVWSMFFNGLLLGVIGVACQQHGMSVDLWSFVAPHGSLELPSIILSGAAGLRLGYGVLFPGIYRWRDSIAQAGVEAAQLVSGIVPLLVIAGTLEGFFSPSNAPVWLKFTVGGSLFVLLVSWLFRPAKAAGESREVGDPRATPIERAGLPVFAASLLSLALAISIVRIVVGIVRHNVAATIFFAVTGALVGIADFVLFKNVFRHASRHGETGGKHA